MSGSADSEAESTGGRPADTTLDCLCIATKAASTAASEPYDASNLLDKLSNQDTLQLHYRQAMRREQRLLGERLGLSRGDVLSVGCGWHPGRHLFPAPRFRIVAVDADPARVEGVMETARAD